MSIPAEASPMSATREQPKLSHAVEALHRLVGELEPGERLPTVQTLRARFCVSLTTLNSALTVLEERGVLVRKNGIGVFVAPRVLRNIVLLCDPSFFEGSSQSPLWGALARELRLHAEHEGGSLEFQFSRVAGAKNPPVSPFLAKAITQEQVHGVLAIGLHFETVEFLQNSGVPMVGFACWGDERTHHVSFAHDHEFYEGGAGILREQGCERIEMWRPVMSWLWPRYADHDAAWRRNDRDAQAGWNEAMGGQGFASALYRSVLSCADELKWTPLAGAITHTEQGALLARHVFSRPRSQWPDGLLFWDDLLAHGALGVLEEMNIEAGRDVKVVSQSNAGSPVLARERGSLTLLEFSPREVVDTMFEVLHALMRGEEVAPQYHLIHAVRRDIKRGLE